MVTVQLNFVYKNRDQALVSCSCFKVKQRGFEEHCAIYQTMKLSNLFNHFVPQFPHLSYGG